MTMGNTPRGTLMLRVNIIAARPRNAGRIASPAMGPEPLYLTPSAVSIDKPPRLRISAMQ
jgi:hypothetical protein